MNKVVDIDCKNVLDFINEEEIKHFKMQALDAREKLINKSYKGSNFLGWVDYFENISKTEIDEIKTVADKIKSESDVLVIIGIGGSYLGSKAVINILDSYFPSKDKKLETIFCGNSISGEYLSDLLRYLDNKDFSVNVISKSGTTTEPAIAFRAIRALLEKKYQDNYRKRVYVTTDKTKGALRNLVNNEKYQSFIIPDDIGGRYSVITTVGLLPICAAGYDIDEFIKGIKHAREHFIKEEYENNAALQYAAIRNILYNKGKFIEILVSYEPKFHYFSEWWKQLYGESEGKGGKGIFPASVTYSTDLHSLGQYVQDGNRILFETIVNIKKFSKDYKVIKIDNDFDGLNYLAGKSMGYINEIASEATILAHVSGGVPNLIINVDINNLYCLGYLMYFFMFACGVSGYILGVNPFDQEGVEEYKKNMFALLGKTGYEELAHLLKQRIQR